MAPAIQGELTGHAGRFGIVVSRYNESVTSRLLKGAVDVLKRHGVSDDRITTVSVPGAWEIGLTAQELLATHRFAAIICLGAVIRGETTHHEHIGAAAARSIAEVSIRSGIPVAFGVLTAETDEQADERAGGKHGNKGEEAALAALEMVGLLTKIRAMGREK